MNQLVDEAIRVLRANDRGRFTVPSEGLYPHQWLWDSAWIALGWRHLHEARAWQELESLFDAQWPDGMLPHILFREDSTSYFPGPAVWGTPTHPSRPPSSGITQPPVLATVLRRLYEESLDKARARTMAVRLLPRVLAFHRWLYRVRDPQGTGLVAIVHPWESGMDNSPAWDEALLRVPLPEDPDSRQVLDSLQEARRDLRHVDGSQRPTDQEYQRYIALVLHFRTFRYDGARVGREAPFQVVDAGFNALLHRANRDLLALLRAVTGGSRPVGDEGDEAQRSTGDHAEDSAANLHGAIREVEGWLARAEAAWPRLWNDELGLYTSLDRITGRPIPVPTAGGLLPLFAGLPDGERARRLVATIQAWGRHCRFLVPTTAPEHPSFDPLRYWRGPVWVVTNRLLWEAVRDYGHEEPARRIAHDTFALVQKEGFREYYHPETGVGLGGRGFSWSAALVLDWAVQTSR